MFNILPFYLGIPIVRTMLADVLKVAITSAAGLKDEIEYWRGSGTLCFDSSATTFSPASTPEADIFSAVCAELAQQKIFRARTSEEMDILKKHLYILRIQNSPLGGLCLVPEENGWYELCALWSGFIKGGYVGKALVEHAKKQVGTQKAQLFALTKSKSASKLFDASGFQSLGFLSVLQKNPPFHLPHKLEQYDVSIRDPQLFTYLPQ